MTTINVVAINGALCEALGLDPADIKSVTIRLTAADAPRVDVEYSRSFLSRHPEIAGALGRFKLVPEDVDDG